MKGDFARVTFDPTLHFTRVLQQQGRVLLEADWNEQNAIGLHLLRSLITDLVGRCWAVGSGFTIDTAKDGGIEEDPGKWKVTPGHLYVDGILCENDRDDCTLAGQPFAPTPDDEGTSTFEGLDAPFAIWLDAWERHVSWVEAPSIDGITPSRLLDPALNGVETCSRAQVVWQLRALGLDAATARLDAVLGALEVRKKAAPDESAKEKIAARIEATKELRDGIASAGGGFLDGDDACTQIRSVLDARADQCWPALRAQVGPVESDDDPCLISPDAAFRGVENHLYRVEIHRDGAAAEGTGATFKWSRENGSVIFPITDPGSMRERADDGTTQLTVSLATLGRDLRLGLEVGDWVELVDDDYTLAQRALPLLQVASIDEAERTVTLDVPKTVTPYAPGPGRHPLLRRWDQREGVGPDGVLPVAEDTDWGDGITLEDGIQIRFEPGGLYATGDYWVIPARVATGRIEWPQEYDATAEKQVAAAVPASGRHHVAVLGVVNSDSSFSGDCCCRFDSLCEQQAHPKAMPKGMPERRTGEDAVPPAVHARPAGGARRRPRER